MNANTIRNYLVPPNGEAVRIDDFDRPCWLVASYDLVFANSAIEAKNLGDAIGASGEIPLSNSLLFFEKLRGIYVYNCLFLAPFQEPGLATIMARD